MIAVLPIIKESVNIALRAPTVKSTDFNRKKTNFEENFFYH